MKTRLRPATLLVLLTPLTLAACTTGEPGSTASQSPWVRQKQKPQTPEAHLDLAEEAMAAGPGWKFQVRGVEKLTLRGRQNEAIYSGVLERTQNPMALHGLGTVTTGAGAGQRTHGEELFVLDDTGYLNSERSGEWKEAPATDPEMANKVEDPVAALADFRGYMQRATGVDVTLMKSAYGNQITLKADVTSRKLGGVRDRPWAAKAQREVEPTLDRLREAGIRVSHAQLTLVRLEEELVLDSATHRVLTHWFRFTVRMPYGSDDITYTQEVKETNRGEFKERIEGPDAA
ncbi:hypothetical protein [Streptomyces sp. NPDC050164]|uniref:hypothetical protein n=1 Tax=Streptomyces sp. NPDC050164 TaxID=3365605 RepID=UPI0037AF5C08